LAIDGRLPEGRYLRGRLLWGPYGGWNHAGALRELVAAVRGRPNLVEAHHWLGQLFLHVGLLKEAERAFAEALAMNPEDTYARLHLGLVRYVEGRYSEALEISEPVASQNPTPWSHYQMALCHLRLERREGAREWLELGSRLFPGDVLFHSVTGLIAALEGDRALARRHIDLTVQNRKAFGHHHHPQYDIACIHALLGERKPALDWLAEAGRNGFPCHPLFERDPFLEEIREEEGFRSLIEEFRSESEGYARLSAELAASPSGDAGLSS
jgi:tetratricopeptide (TPR) repeat protein